MVVIAGEPIRAQELQLTVAGWGGDFQDAWREAVIKPFEE